MKTHIFAALALLAAPSVLAAVAAVPPVHDNAVLARDTSDLDDVSPVQLEALVLLLDAVHDIPNDVLDAGQDSASQWFATEAFPILAGGGANEVVVARSDVIVSERSSADTQLVETTGLLSCLASIAWFLAENRIPIAKLRRAKRIIDDLGGVRKAAQKLLKGKKDKKKLIAEGGQILWELFEIFSGFGDVIENCSS